LARRVIKDMREHGVELEPAMYCDLVGLLAVAMRRPNVTRNEIVRNLRCAWHIVGEARRHCSGLDWTVLLNEVIGVYVAAGFSNYAIEMLQQFAVFGASPNSQTYLTLLEMLGRDMKDIGRFFALWDALPKTPQPSADLYNLALEVALESRSSRRTCVVLEEMLEASVFPTPQLTERLAQVGRHVIQIHSLVAKLIAVNKSTRVASAKRENALLQTHVDERELELATQGLTVRSPSPAQEARAKYFDSLHKKGFFRRPWLPLGEYIASKRKGGEEYARKHDKPRPNILAS